MDQAVYRQWWPLHLRAVQGEALSPEEKALYLHGLNELEANESFPGQADRLRQVQEEIQATARENAHLQQRRQELENEVSALQALLRDKLPA